MYVQSLLLFSMQKKTRSPLQALDEEMARTRVDGEEGEREERTVDPRLEQKSQVGNSF